MKGFLEYRKNIETCGLTAALTRTIDIDYLAGWGGGFLVHLSFLEIMMSHKPSVSKITLLIPEMRITGTSTLGINLNSRRDGDFTI